MVGFFKNLSIRKKLLLGTAVAGAGIGLFITLFFAYHLQQQIMYVTRQAALQVVGFAAATIRADLAAGNTAEVQKKIDEMRRNRTLVFAIVYDAHGTIVAAVNAPRGERILAEHKQLDEGFTLEKERAFISMPVMYRGSRIGTLVVCVSLVHIIHMVQETVLVAAAASSAIIAMLLIFFAFIGTLITRPLNQLINAALQIARSDFSRRIPVTSRDEVGRLSAAFNEMSERLQLIVSQLEQSEHTYRLHFENVSDLIYAVRPDYTVASMSPSVLPVLGYNAQDIIGKAIDAAGIIAPEHLEDFRQQVHRALNGERVGAVEYIFITHDGTAKFFDTSFSPLMEDGTVNAVICVSRDTTQQHRMLQELLETRDSLNNIIESSQDAIVACDSTGHIIKVNRYFLDLYGIESDAEIIGKRLNTFMVTEPGTYRLSSGEELVIDEEYFKDAQIHVDELFETNKLINWQTYLYTKKGTVVPVELSAVLNKTATGELIGSVGIMRDITERRKAEREIREAKEFMESIIESSRDGIIITSLGGEILSANSAMERITGLPRESLIGKHSSMLTVDDREMRRMVQERIQELMEKGFVTYESFFKTPQGSYVELEWNASMIRDASGAYTAGVAIIRDVTQRRAMERQLVQAEKLRSLGELASGVAHDFNNVLAAILGRTQLLLKLLERPGSGPERRASWIELKKGLHIIEKAALDAAETVRRIQEFSRTRDEDRLFTALNINDIITDAIEFTRSFWKDAAESQGVKVRIIRNQTPVPPIRGSATELREVFINLIKNAVEAMPHGGDIVIQTAAEPNHVLITVRDTGLGIPEEHRTKIFDPFFTTKGPQASGLGMSVSYGIINRHQGAITFESEEGKGTTFLIRLPVARDSAAPAEQPTVPSTTSSATVLVIDDEKDVRDTLVDILEAGGHTAVAAASGPQGLKLFTQQRFDLVFTDLGMPGMSGYQIAEQIKKADRSIPVCLITGWEVPLTAEQRTEAGIDFVINKPFQMHQVFDLVRKALELRSHLVQTI
ncbi:MAG: PAS domain S-box protein [Desulfobacterota bacterium]|nr:PAS domain S-box protein [Thermodesulfobacteriota bacterium]